MSQPLKQSTKNIPRGTTVIIIDEFGDLGAPRKKHRYFGYAVSKTKNPNQFAHLTDINREKHGREFKARDDSPEGRKEIIEGIRDARVATSAVYVDKKNPPRGWKNGRSSDSAVWLLTETIYDSIPENGRVKMIIDHHTAYGERVDKMIDDLSTETRTVTGKQWNSDAGPYSDLLQTHDYVAYVAGSAIEFDDPTLSSMLGMKIKKIERSGDKPKPKVRK